MNARKQAIGPIELVVATPSVAAETVCAIAAGLGGRHVHLANAYTIALADRRDELRETLRHDAAVNYPDGRPLSWVSKLRGDKQPLCQVRGPQLFIDVLRAGRRYGLKHFLLGATPEVLAKLEGAIAREAPQAEIVGSDSPPFRELTPEEYAEIDMKVRRSGANIVWVGLGTPKQDLESKRITCNTGIVAVAIGAAFDFTAGTKKTAPAWMTRIGIEWLFRLLAEPRRLWKRYLVGNVQFLRTIASYRLSSR